MINTFLTKKTRRAQLGRAFCTTLAEVPQAREALRARLAPFCKTGAEVVIADPDQYHGGLGSPANWILHGHAPLA